MLTKALKAVYKLDDSGSFSCCYSLPSFRLFMKLSLFISSIRLKES